MFSNVEIDIYTDLLVIKSMAGNGITKTAQDLSVHDLVDKVKGYFGSKIEKGNEVSSVLNLLAPVGLKMLFRALGFSWISWIAGAGAAAMGIDISGILSSVYESVKSLISGGKKVSSSQIKGTVSSAVLSNLGGDTANASDKQSLSKSLSDVRRLKLAAISHQHNITKLAGPEKKIVGNILSRVLSVIFSVALAAAGLTVAGDIINKIIGRPNDLDGSKAKSKETQQVESAPASTQKKFPIKSSYTENRHSGNWVVNIPNNKSSIENMLISFAKKVYDGLDGLENAIRQTAGFQVIADDIIENNASSEGDTLVFIPNKFVSEKNIVDFFIDDVAKSSK